MILDSRRYARSLLLFVCGLAVLSASPAQAADVTAFLQGGWPGGRSGSGFGVAIPLLTEMISFEGEYANSGSSIDAAGFSVFTGSVRFSFPDDIARFRPYLSIGLGAYRQSRASLGESSFASSEGGGTFVRLLGPLSARFDIRFFQLRNAPFTSRERRVYLGASLRF